ncbi:TPA: hypothetical protein DF272_03350 [Candidatus Falkowbacteria bacterium]|nr:hypothetical protein [Candidatus Falkowbacteria bacterium]
MTERTDQKQAAWNHYFEHGNPVMALMLWVQKKLLMPQFVKIIQPYLMAGDSVLEAGCGTAMSTINLAKTTKIKAFGLDLSNEALIRATTLARQNDVDFTAIFGNIESMPFPDNKFRLVWNQGLLEHFDHPVAILHEMARVAEIVFVAVPRKTTLRFFVQKVKAMFGLAADDIFYLYTEDQLVDIIKSEPSLAFKSSGSFNVLGIFSWTWVCGVKLKNNLPNQ